MNEYPLPDEGATEELARALAKAVSPGSTIGLSGNLGAGKTTLVRYLVKALSGDSRQVASPSFTLSYDYETGSGTIVEHWDLYRLTVAPEELHEPPSGRTIRFIEWPERCPEVLPSLDLALELAMSDTGERRARWSGRFSDTLARCVATSKEQA
jgi:tRNA threonylcarbamoyladenosine biosynthesis protein TsaE